jgi:hypothetical protein
MFSIPVAGPAKTAIAVTISLHPAGGAPTIADGGGHV